MFLFLLLSAKSAWTQTVESSEIEVKLYLPTHVKNVLKPTDKLEIYFTTFPRDSAVKILPKVIGKKVKENVYTFMMPQMRFWHVGFRIGAYGDFKLCVDNRYGEAQGNHDFNLHLEMYNPDFTKPKFLPPCIVRDDSDDE